MKPNLKFSHQILLFVTLPALIQIVCVSLLWINFNKLTESYDLEAEASDYLSENVKFLSQLMTCAAAQAMYQATKEPRYDADFHRILASATKTSIALKDRAKRTLGQNNSLDTLYSALTNLSESGRRAETTQDQVEMAVAFFQVRRVIANVNRLSLNLLDDLNEKRKSVARAHIKAKETFFDIIFAGIALNTVLIAIYWFFIYRKTSRRFKQLEENVIALGASQPLQHELAGGDDLKAFDDVLHRIAAVQRDARIKEQAIVTHAVDVICALDENFKFTQVNPAATGLWNIDTADLLGRNLISMIRPEERESVSSTLKSCMNSEEIASFELGIVSGSNQSVQMQWNVMWSSELKQLFCVAHDITERTRLERLRRELVAMVSHDLRSPMTSMQLTLNILSSGSLGEIPEAALKRINRLEISLSQLVELVNDFLEVEKLESPDFVISTAPCRAFTIVENGCRLIEELAAQKQIRIEINCDEFEFDCDEVRLTRVITNLVSNAIKFSPAQSSIRVSANRDPEYAVFAVTDEGRGIPVEKQQTMFERFKQLEIDDERIKKGTGLGLAVCKSIVNAHAGEIFVESEVSKGSTFVFKIPLQRGHKL